MSARERRERALCMQRMNKYAVWIALSENRQDSNDEKERTEASGESRAEERRKEGGNVTVVGARSRRRDHVQREVRVCVFRYPRKIIQLDYLFC